MSKIKGGGGPLRAALKRLLGNLFRAHNWKERNYFAFVVNQYCLCMAPTVAAIAQKEKLLEKKEKRLAKKQNKLSKALVVAPKAVQQSSGMKVAKQKAKQQVVQHMGQLIASRKAMPNPFLMGLLLPAQYGPVCYPDKFGDRTVLGRLKYVGVVTVDDTSGEAVFVVNPTMPDNIVMPTLTTGTTVFSSFTRFALTNGDLTKGLQVPWKFTTSGYTFPSGMEDAMLIGGDSYIPFFTSNLGGTISGYVGAYRLPEGADGTIASFNVVSGSYYYTGTVTPRIQCYDANYVLLNTYALTAGTPQVVQAGTVFIVPSAQGGSASNSVRDWTVNITLPAGNSVPNWIPCQDYDTLAGPDGDGGNIYESYRTTGLSVLTSYVGDVTKEGGQISSAFIQGGETIEDLNLFTFQSVASLPQARTGPLRLGDYSFWKPVDNADMDFRKVNTDNSDASFPYIVIAISQTEKALQVLRVEVQLCVEATTRRAFMFPRPSVVDEYQIQAANMALQGIPMSMENPLHLEEIKRFLKNILQKGSEMYTAIRPHLPAITSAAKVLAATLI